MALKLILFTETENVGPVRTDPFTFTISAGYLEQSKEPKRVELWIQII